MAALYLDYRTRLFVSILVFAYIYVLYTCAEREEGVERERKKTRGGAAQGNGESRLWRGKGTERDTMANGILLFQMAIAVSPSLLRGMCLVKSFSNIFSPRSSCFLYIYISFNYTQPKLLSREKEKLKLTRQSRLRSFIISPV